MAKFSVGQKVVCIDDKDWHGTLSNGKIYEVEDVDRPLKLIKLRNIPLFMRSNRFKLYEEKEEIMSNTKKPHIHAEMIKAWEDGEAIEFSGKGKEYWNAADFPSWSVALDYRIKKEPTYPKTSMHHKDIREIYNNSIVHGDAITAIANEAIKHFITSGDMDKYLESLK